MRETKKAILELEDGTVFEGKSFGFEKACSGEVVFNTAMTGFALEMLRRLRFDKVFVTSACVSAEFGLSIQRTRNMSIYTILSSARKVYGLYPSAKIGMDSILSLCPVDTLDVLITDEDASEEDLKKIDEKGVEIWLAK